MTASAVMAPRPRKKDGRLGFIRRAVLVLRFRGQLRKGFACRWCRENWEFPHRPCYTVYCLCPGCK